MGFILVVIGFILVVTRLILTPLVVRIMVVTRFWRGVTRFILVVRIMEIFVCILKIYSIGFQRFADAECCRMVVTRFVKTSYHHKTSYPQDVKSNFLGGKNYLGGNSFCKNELPP